MVISVMSYQAANDSETTIIKAAIHKPCFLAYFIYTSHSLRLSTSRQYGKAAFMSPSVKCVDFIGSESCPLRKDNSINEV